jgi:hypothetical protein
MSLRLQIILLILLIIIFLFLINQVKKKAVALKYTLAWLLLDVALMILTCFPNLLQVISGMLGITSPINMIFFCGFVLALIVIYTLTVALSRNSDRIRSLAQSIALNEYRTKKDKEGV